MKKKKSIVLLVAIVFLLSLVGCVKVDTNLKVNSDGSSDLTLLYGVNKQVASLSEDLVADMEKSKEEAINNGFKAVNYKDKEYIGLKLSKHFDSFDQIQSPGEKKLFNFKVVEDKHFFKTIYHVKGSFDFKDMQNQSGDETEQQMASAMANQMDLSFTLQLPTKAGKNNASSEKNDGKTLRWDFIANEKNEVEFEFSKLNLLNIGLVIGVLLFILLFIYLISKRKIHTSTALQFGDF